MEPSGVRPVFTDVQEMIRNTMEMMGMNLGCMRISLPFIRREPCIREMGAGKEGVDALCPLDLYAGH